MGRLPLVRWILLALATSSMALAQAPLELVEAICMSRWGRDRRCTVDWTMDGDRVRRIRVFDSRATVDGMKIGDSHAQHAERFSQCYTETELIHALMCELRTIPDGYAVMTLEPAEFHDPPTQEQLTNARIEWFDVSFNTETGE